MRRKRIFVSCGQQTEEEIRLGRDIAKAIEARGMTPFFAQDVHSPGGLNAEVFSAIQRCDGFLAVLHKRGEVRYADFPVIQRSSVWIQQEIAILAYRTFMQGKPVPIRVYSEKGIRREGVMESAIVNPIEFERSEEVVAGVEAWLTSREFEEHPIVARREELFARRIEGLGVEEWLMLDLIAAHIVGPGEVADFHSVKADFAEILRAQVKAEQEKETLHRKAFERLTTVGLVLQEANPATGKIKLSIPNQWWDLVLDELRNQGRRV